ncbi:hypothetical protein [Kribbella italica]|uniref:Uncharacterized protein n=1 Tax=Kribbella italica TaxID=1540520 RepID=A0A7W9MXM9_9ACTN|nr:hypothetical protein [Kribbella italica]MBB5839939.1 hypothetical protein [Kribbella italica]
MRQLNARLTVVVAVVAVAAVAGGGVLASRQGPQTSTADASPLGGQPSPSPTPTPTTPKPPTKTPSVTPTTPPASKPGVAGPRTVAVSLAKLDQGRAPQLVHTLGRKVSGGPDQAFTAPGKDRIIAATQAGSSTYVLESREPDLVLVRTNNADESSEVRDVTTLVGAIDGSFAAFASQKQKTTGEQLAGSTLYAEDGGEGKYRLDLPDSWNIQVIAVAAGKVFYASTPREDGVPKLYTWVPGRSSATAVKGINSPTAVSADGALVAAAESIGGAGSCSNVTELATGKKLWRTCEYMVRGFTPDKSAFIAGPAYEDGYASLSSWLLDGKTGVLLREWTGVSFRHVRAEDDQHLLMEVDDGPDTKGAIIRCTISSGDCERATPITPGDQFGLGS